VKISRRDVLRASAAIGGAAVAGEAARASGAGAAVVGAASAAQAVGGGGQSAGLPAAFDGLRPPGDRVKPITTEEYQARIAKAQTLMASAAGSVGGGSGGGGKFDALFVAPGTTLSYYTGLRWWPSERLLALLVPREGAPMLVCPAFEEARLREQMRWPIEVRTWQEDESPYAVAAKWFGERGIRTGALGVEQTTAYVFFDGLRRAAPALTYTSGDPITVGCRAVKSEHELQLMRLACEATCAVYKATFASLREGMTQRDVERLVQRGYAKMGLRGEASVTFGASSALPHGSREEQVLREGVGVMIDDGTEIEGYQSDVTRMGVLGKPPEKLRRAFEIVRGAQNAALAAAVAGRPCGGVDDAARKVIVDAGFGPGYKYFEHRLGHGIGLDGHESPYLVHGNEIVLQPGMTFSNEPGIYVPGEYGVRCEDDMVIAESGAAVLLTYGFQESLEKPIS
jgi:Xaa-Pro dipeptidase